MRVARMTADWWQIATNPHPKKFPNGAFHWVDDASIVDRLDHHNFEDVSKDCCVTPGNHDHAARIATLVTMIKAGVELKRIHLHITSKHINIEDGNHRFRAYQFLNRMDKMRFYVTGRVEILTMSYEWHPDYFWHRGRLSGVRSLTR